MDGAALNGIADMGIQPLTMTPPRFYWKPSGFSMTNVIFIRDLAVCKSEDFGL